MFLGNQWIFSSVEKCVCVCVSLKTHSVFLGHDVLLEEFEQWKKLDIFSSSMGHRHPSRKIMLVKLKVFFPQFVGPNTSKEVSIKCLKLISTNNFRTYIWHYAWDFGPFLQCVIQELRNNILQQLHPPGNLFTGFNNSSGARVNDSTIREEIITVSSKIGWDQRSKNRRWRMDTNGATATKVGSFCLCSWLILGRFFKNGSHGSRHDGATQRDSRDYPRQGKKGQK